MKAIALLAALLVNAELLAVNAQYPQEKVRITVPQW
jgi:hypothetical protein